MKRKLLVAGSATLLLSACATGSGTQTAAGSPQATVSASTAESTAVSTSREDLGLALAMVGCSGSLPLDYSGGVDPEGDFQLFGRISGYLDQKADEQGLINWDKLSTTSKNIYDFDMWQEKNTTASLAAAASTDYRWETLNRAWLGLRKSAFAQWNKGGISAGVAGMRVEDAEGQAMITICKIVLKEISEKVATTNESVWQWVARVADGTLPPTFEEYQDSL